MIISLFSKDITTVKHIKISQIYLSDHAPLQMTLRSSKKKRGGIWRFNNSLLSENEFKTKLKGVLQDYIMYNDTEDINPVILWEGAKVVLRGEIIAYASFRKKQKENARKSLEKKIEELEKAHKTSGETSILKNLKEAKAEINEFLNMEVEKSLSFVRQRTYDGGPRAAKVLAYKF